MAHIVLVDDVKLVRATLAKFLSTLGHEVTQSESVPAALASVRDRRPHLVVTDLWMPEVDGLTLIQALSRDTPRVPVIAITGGTPGISEGDSRETALAAGALAVLMKPVTRQDLLAAVEQALSRSR